MSAEPDAPFLTQDSFVSEVRRARSIAPLYGKMFAALSLQVALLLVEPDPWIKHPINVVMSVWLARIIYGITGRRADLWITVALGVTPAVLDLAVPWETAGVALDFGKSLLWMAFPAFLGARLFPSLFEARHISHHELLGAVGLYMLIGMAFANVHETIFLVDPNGIHFAFLATGEEPNYGNFLYFSFVTLATLGFGDVAPVHPVAQLAVVIESVMGLMFMAIMVARLVGLHTSSQGQPPSS